MPFADVTEDEHDTNHPRVHIKDGGGAIVNMKLISIFTDQNGMIGKPDNFA